jgi:hypothetical protein
MYIKQDHLLGQLLAAAIELMVGDKALIAHAGGCPYGFYADVYAPFVLGEGYFTPLKEHMKNFLLKDRIAVYTMEKKNAASFLTHKGKKRELKKLEEFPEGQVCLLEIENSIFLSKQADPSWEHLEDFSIDRLELLERGGVRFFGKRTGIKPLSNFHFDNLHLYGKWMQKEFLWNQKGVSLKKLWKDKFEKFVLKEGVEMIDLGPLSKETFKKVKHLDIPFTTQWIEQESYTQQDPFFGWKGLERQTADRFFYLVKNQNVREAMSSCLRLIEKWTKILGIRGNFTDSDRGRVSWMVQDPFGATFEGPFVERHPSGCLTGSIMGPLELLIAIHAEEKFTWNLENQE